MSSSTRRPRSVEEIVKEAQNFDHTTKYPLRIAIRTAQNILNQASQCERNGNMQDAYLFFYRHAEFCMSGIAAHPDRKQPEFKASVSRITREVKADLEKLENLKPEISKRYERYRASLQRIAEARQRERHRDRPSSSPNPTSRSPSPSSLAAFDGSSQVLHAAEHTGLALQLAHRELRRRGLRPDPEGTKNESKEFEDLTRNIRNLGRQLDRRDDVVQNTEVSTMFEYPGIHSHQETPFASTATNLDNPTREQFDPPPVPDKMALVQPTPPTLPTKGPAIPARPEPMPSSEYTFKTTAKTEAGVPLRPLFIPTELRPRFMSLAADNTRNSLETCGILCGSLISNALFISHLVIPEQISTSDTCDTTEAGDNALFDYVDGQELMVCGWIHTHPTQTCFLSSRDLHTSVGYQVMLPESVAIVCAPTRNPDYGIFRLTDPPGKQAILNCNQQGLFHPHAQSNLYTDASSPGHVSELKGLQFQVVDLRNG